MKNIYAINMAVLLCTLGHAEVTTVKLDYQNFDFKNSDIKDQGATYGVALDYKTNNNLYQLYYEKTKTDTYQPPLPEDLNVDRVYFKYSHAFEGKHGVSLSYATIDDNLVKETDGGNIYGLGYTYADLGVTQYVSDYERFNVYQTDLKYTYKKAFGALKIATTILGTYIHLQDKNSNPLSANAQEDYFTPALKVHAHYNTYHMGAGAYFGERIFAVTNDGFRVQHHAMEFNKTYMVGFGKHFDAIDVNLKYVYQESTETPTRNENVQIQNMIVQIGYRF